MEISRGMLSGLPKSGFTMIHSIFEESGWDTMGTGIEKKRITAMTRARQTKRKIFFMSNTSYKGRHRSRFGRISPVTSLYLGYTGEARVTDHEKWILRGSALVITESIGFSEKSTEKENS